MCELYRTASIGVNDSYMHDIPQRSSFCLSSSNAPFPLLSRMLDQIRTARYETNDTHFLHELPISAPHE